MIKIFYSTDWHMKGRNPQTRKDSFPTTIEAKVTRFFRLGHELNVDIFVSSGDYFDSPYTSSEYVTYVGKLIERELKGKKLYGTWGNHDIKGYNPKTVTQSPIGVFQEFSPYFEILEREPITLNLTGGKVKLSGISSYAQLDRHILDPDTGDIIEHRARDYVIEESDGTPHIHVVHGYLSPKPILDSIPHTVIEEMKHTKATVTLTGHEHTGFPVTKIDHGLLYNPGALGRVHASHTEMNRMPMYALITIHDDGTPEIEPIVCDVAKPGEEVMDRSVLDAKREKEAILQQARGDIREVLKGMNIQGIDLNLIMSKYEGTTKPQVFSEAKKRLGL